MESMLLFTHELDLARGLMVYVVRRKGYIKQDSSYPVDFELSTR